MLTIELPERKFRLSRGVTLTAQEAKREHARLIGVYAKQAQRLEYWKRAGRYGDGRPEQAWRDLFATYRELRELGQLMAGGN